MLPSRTERKAYLRALLALLLVGTILLTGLYLVGHFASGLLHRAMIPLFHAEERVFSFAGRTYLAVSEGYALAGKIETLERELADAKLLVLDRNRLYEENIALKESLGRNTDPRPLLASVVLHPPRTPYDTLLLDVGSRDGVAVADLVSAGGSLVIGSIVEVFPFSSRVRLFSSPGESREALLRTNEGVHSALLEGVGGGSLRMVVPRGLLVVPGDEVSVPSINATLAGIVAKVEYSETDTLQTVFLHLPINLFELERVFVWRAGRAGAE